MDSFDCRRSSRFKNPRDLRAAPDAESHPFGRRYFRGNQITVRQKCHDTQPARHQCRIGPPGRVRFHICSSVLIAGSHRLQDAIQTDIVLQSCESSPESIPGEDSVSSRTIQQPVRVKVTGRRIDLPALGSTLNRMDFRSWADPTTGSLSRLQQSAFKSHPVQLPTVAIRIPQEIDFHRHLASPARDDSKTGPMSCPAESVPLLEALEVNARLWGKCFTDLPTGRELSFEQHDGTSRLRQFERGGASGRSASQDENPRFVVPHVGLLSTVLAEAPEFSACRE